MNLEHEIKQALRPRSAPEGFASRVMERIAREERPARRVHWRLAAASVALVAVLGAWETHAVIERKRGEMARDQVMRALTIAGSKVRYAREQVHDIGTR